MMTKMHRKAFHAGVCIIVILVAQAGAPNE